MLTMSALPRSLNCDGSLVFPRASNASVFADAGHDEHEELMRHVIAGTLPPRLAAIVPVGARPEVKVAINVATGEGRIIGEGSGRDYGPLGPFEIPGSIDVLGVEGDAVIIIDWKTGYKDVDPAERNWQMWGYALAACRALGKSRAIIRIAYTNQPGQPIDEHEIDAFDLADFATRLHQLNVREARLTLAYKGGETPTTNEGNWCRHCASKSICPSKVGLLVQIAEKGLAVIGDTAMTQERAVAAYEQLVRVEMLVKDARDRLNTYVDETGPLMLGNGRAYGRYVRNGNERLDGNVAVQAIAQVVGESAKEFESVAIERKTTKAAIERAAKAVGAKKGLAVAVIKKIRELGGATHASDTMPVGEYVIDKNEPAGKPALDMAAVNQLLESA